MILCDIDFIQLIVHLVDRFKIAFVPWQDMDMYVGHALPCIGTILHRDGEALGTRLALEAGPDHLHRKEEVGDLLR